MSGPIVFYSADMGCIKTASGLLIDPFRPNPDCILWSDICHSQSLICRFTGHCRVLYTVGLHTVLVHHLVRKLAPDDVNAHRWALMHDGSEAYFNDLASPVKKELPEYKAAEKAFQAVLATKFGLSEAMPDVVHAADWLAILVEAHDLFAFAHPGEYGEMEWPDFTLQQALREIFYPGMKVPGDVVEMLVPRMVRAKLLSLYPISGFIGV